MKIKQIKIITKGHFVKLLDYSTIEIDRQLISKYFLLNLLKTISALNPYLLRILS